MTLAALQTRFHGAITGSGAPGDAGWDEAQRRGLAVYRNAEDLIQLGAYVSGSNPKLDASIRTREQILSFLKQDAQEKAPLDRTLNGLAELASAL